MARSFSKGDPGKVAYTNARLIDPWKDLDEAGSLLTEGNRIAEVGPGLFADGIPDGIHTVDCGGNVLAPGLIDMRAFLGEPGFEHKETLATGTEAAAVGGVTTVICLPGTDPVIDDTALVEYIERRAREDAVVRVHPMGALTNGTEGREMTEMGLLAEAGAVAFTDGDRAVADAQLMRRALAYASGLDLLIVQHIEEAALASAGCMNEGELALRLGLPSIPVAAEVIALERDLQLVELTGGRYHAACISAGETVARLQQAKAKGLPVSAGVAVHHFALNETAVGEYRSFAKTSPPLRAEEDRQALIQGMRDGTIDVIVSDHSPQDQESKRQPFIQAANGIAGLETMLPLALELHHNGSVPLMRVLEMMTAAPARLLGLDVGRLEVGAPADLAVIDIDTPWRLSEDGLVAKSKNTPFDGRPVQGRALRTVVAGHTVYEFAALT
ncbi:MAG: dihydroorotase [Alphaproteobacteria bacterium]|nr:dihydroorotase [Alphaproteobacteria bacterium]